MTISEWAQSPAGRYGPIRDPRNNERDASVMPHTATEAKTRVAAPSELSPMIQPLVLIVDDDTDILDVLDMLFTDDGFRTVCCSTSEAALAALAAEPAHLLITDLRLAGGTGLDLIRDVRALYGDVPSVIVLTALRPALGSTEATQVGQLGVHVIAKPFDIDDLLGVARRLTGWPGGTLF